MTKLLVVVAVSVLAISAFAQDTSTVPSRETAREKMMRERSGWSEKIDDELANLPEDVRRRCKDAKDRADALGRQIQEIKVDSLSPEELRAKIHELIARKKAEADERIKQAMEKIEEYKSAHRAEIEAARAEVKARIEAKKAELEAKRAEIEKIIAEKKAEIAAREKTKRE
jgi:Tfp pilus assembly protein PilN